MTQIQSNYYRSTPTNYKLFEAIIIFSTVVVGGYALSIFVPIYIGGKSRSSGREGVLSFYEVILENQIQILLVLIIIGVIASLVSIKSKKTSMW